MIDLCLPLHVDWTGGLTIPVYLDRLTDLGITAVEVQLPPTLQLEDLDHWSALVAQVRERKLKLSIHAPLTGDPGIWSGVAQWISRLAIPDPLTLVVHGCTATRPSSGLVARTMTHIRSLLMAVPSAVTVAVEQGWNSGVMIGIGSFVRELRNRSLKQHMQRPAGVGSGMGAMTAPSRQPRPTADDVFDPPLQSSWWQTLRRSDGFSGTGTREETLQVVMEVDQPNCVIAWDVAHDWLGGARGGVSDWHSMPSADFLNRVGYVRLHDVDDQGHDHYPLVIGNVPYASQLRPLLRYGFAGTVCLAIRYTPQTRHFGDRWHVLERSLTVARQVLRLT
jgi:sugar phosphate isomerase/epimerase